MTLGDSVTTKPTEPQFSEQRSVEVDIPRSFTVYNATSVIAERFPALKPMEVDILWETGEELVVKADPESESESETNGLSEIEDGDSKKQPMLRDELLVPRTRRIGTWLEGPAATLRLEKRLSSRKGS